MADARHGANPERRQTTAQQRLNWAPACAVDLVTVPLHGQGRVSVARATVPAVEALSAVLARHSYQTRVADTGAYNCRQITGGTGYSLHAYGIALDINWSTNHYGPRLVTDMPAAMVAEIESLRTRSGARVWEWGGHWAPNRDAMHFEIDCTPADLATGITPDPEELTMADITAITTRLDKLTTELAATRRDNTELRTAVAGIRSALDTVGRRVRAMHAGNYQDPRGDLTWLEERLAPIAERLDRIESRQ